MIVTLSEFRTKMGTIMESVKKGEQVCVTERGKTIAVIGPPVMGSKPRPDYSSLENTKEAQRLRDAILKGVNRKS